LEEGDADMQQMTVNARAGRRRCATGLIVTAATLITCWADPSCASAQGLPSPKPGHGRIWYEKYCTPCHGVGGAPGEAVFVRDKRPVDLRTYVQRNGGKFPSGDWLQVVVAEPPQNPHTEVWERIQGDEGGGTNSEIAARAAVRSIADYVLSIQAK
jgi:hypothetical protein